MAILLVLCVGAVSAADTNLDNVSLSDSNVCAVDDVIGDEPINELSNTSNITIEVPSSTNVDVNDKEVNFTVSVKDNNETVNITKDELKINLTYNNTVTPIENFTFNNSIVSFKAPVEFDSNSTTALVDVYYNDTKATVTLNILTNITIEVPSSVDMDMEDKMVNFTVSVKNNNEKVNITKDDLKIILTYNNDSVISIDNFTYDNNSVVTFKVPVDFNTTAYIDIYYKSANGTINLNPLAYNKISINSNVAINVKKEVEFSVNLTTKNNQTINFTKEDIVLILTYIGADNSTNNYNYTVENYTLNGNKISFTLETVNGTFKQGKLNITYKNDTFEVATLDKVIYFYEIKVLLDESSSQYQNNNIVAQLWNNYNNCAVSGSTLNFNFKNSSMSTVSWGESTNSKGKANRTLDSMNMNSQFQLKGYVAVGNGYVLVISNDLAVGKQCTINVTKASGAFSASNYASAYGSGKKFTVKFTNSKYKSPINGVVRLTIYKGTYNSKTKKWSYSKKALTTTVAVTNTSGITNIGVNLGSGKFKVVISNYDNKNISASSITRYMTISKVSAKVSAKKTVAYYNNGNVFKVRIINSKTKKGLSGASVGFNVYTGKKYKFIQLTTNTNGYASWTVTGLSIGTHKVIVGSTSSGATASVVQTSIVVKKGKTIVTAPKVTTTYKNKTSTFKATVKTAGTKKVIKGIVIKFSVYKNKKLYKTFSVKTNAKGIASFKTYSLAKGTYSVKMTSTNKYYTVSKSSSIVVK